MALSQMQIIQSLGEAMAWFERELNWGVPPTELRHLCGRIGELYAALITNGQMATEVNQRGYDVVSGDGERISVKTTAMMSGGGHVTFNPRSLDEVERIIILRINTEEMQIEKLLDATVEEARSLMSPERAGKQSISLSRFTQSVKPRRGLKSVRKVVFESYTLRELESGTIEVERDTGHGVESISPVMPLLRDLAKQLNLPLINGNGNSFNTRHLGSLVIREIAQESTG
ncbi:hypothetical protein E0X81_08065 [Halomonas sp. GDM18]|nr:hypothetical protein E0X81_08065 [Halomonas sp. GDM18]